MNEKLPIGITYLEWMSARAAYNLFTDVRHAYRGRGIARGLKSHTVRWACNNAIPWLYTGNEASSLPMLGNDQLPMSVEIAEELR